MDFKKLAATLPDGPMLGEKKAPEKKPDTKRLKAARKKK